MTGELSPDGTPFFRLDLAGTKWIAILDTGFSGDLELPLALADHFQGIPSGPQTFILASGLAVTDETYIIDFPFDGHIVSAEAAFNPVTEILLGTHLLRDYRLEIDFPAGTVKLTRVQGP